ncbi:Fe-S cluster assembly ATPase SufC [archaeon]|nr:MAG: Fe-S cluster assembly ATPase SufC [archaeon]
MKLEIKNLHVAVDGKKVVKGVNLAVSEGEVHAIMGPNGAGKSSLSYAIMGHPKYKITKGKIIFDGHDITEFSPDKRAKLGLFLGFQHPLEISGVSVNNFLRTAYRSLKSDSMSILELREFVSKKMSQLKMDKSFAGRGLNEGFSGGEKKLAEILQLVVLQPKIAILDEPDSGTDVDTLKLIAQNIKSVNKKNNTGILLVTHHNRILKYLKPDFVHVLVDGKIAKTGGPELADKLESKGYGWVEA